RNQDRVLGEVLARDEDVDVLELPRLTEVVHELGDGTSRIGRADDFQRSAFVLERRDPEITRNRIDEGIEHHDGTPLSLNELLDHLHAITNIRELRLDVGALAQQRLEGVDLLRRSIVLGDEPRLLGDQTPPGVADGEDRHDVNDGEEQAESDGQGGHREAREDRTAPPQCFDRRMYYTTHIKCI